MFYCATAIGMKKELLEKWHFLVFLSAVVIFGKDFIFTHFPVFRNSVVCSDP